MVPRTNPAIAVPVAIVSVLVFARVSKGAAMVAGVVGYFGVEFYLERRFDEAPDVGEVHHAPRSSTDASREDGDADASRAAESTAAEPPAAESTASDDRPRAFGVGAALCDACGAIISGELDRCEDCQDGSSSRGLDRVVGERRK